MPTAPQPCPKGIPLRPQRRGPPPLRARSVLAAHADLANNREQFPVSEADQGDIATLLLVLVDIQHAALQLAQADGEALREELAAVKGEVVGLARRAARSEDLLKEMVRQAKVGNATATEQADLLDELVESITRDGGERDERGVEGEGPEGQAEEDEPEEDEPEDDTDDDLAEAMREGEGMDEDDLDGDAEPEGDGDGPEEGGQEPTAEVVVPDSVVLAPATEAPPRPRFAHPEVK